MNDKKRIELLRKENDRLQQEIEEYKNREKIHNEKTENNLNEIESMQQEFSEIIKELREKKNKYEELRNEMLELRKKYKSIILNNKKVLKLRRFQL